MDKVNGNAFFVGKRTPFQVSAMIAKLDTFDQNEVGEQDIVLFQDLIETGAAWQMGNFKIANLAKGLLIAGACHGGRTRIA